jgi:hypothetical protein
VAKVPPLSVRVMPAWLNDDASAATSSVSACVPVAYWKENDSLAPAGMPAPHWLAPEPARTQVSVPLLTTFQPWARSREIPAAGS